MPFEVFEHTYFAMLLFHMSTSRINVEVPLSVDVLIRNVQLTFNDSALSTKVSPKRFRHIFMDEAQDVSDCSEI